MFNITGHWEMPIKTKTTVRYHFKLIRMAIIGEKNKVTSVGKDVETLEPAYIAAENVKWCSHFMVNSWAIPQNIKHKVTT